MDYALLETHRQHCRENYALGKKALREGKGRKAAAYFDLALEHCRYVIEHTDDPEERKRYRGLRDNCIAAAASAGKPPSPADNSENDETKAKDDVGKNKEDTPSYKVVRPEDLTLEQALRKLDELEGLDAVKKHVHSWVDLIKVFHLRKARGMTVPDMSFHMVFLGNPGTGKTTVARLMAQIYHALGIVKKGQCVETDRSSLVAGYVGQTALKTQEVIEKALDGVLFIDEAYMLANGGSNDFGQEAIDTLLKAMEDNRHRLVVIVAGYDDLMKSFIESNPGLKSRFKTFVHFADYSGEEMMNIFRGFCKKNEYVLSPEAARRLCEHFNKMYEQRDKAFANGRDARNLFEKIVTRQSRRIAKLCDPDNNTIKEIRSEDLPFNE